MFVIEDFECISLKQKRATIHVLIHVFLCRKKNKLLSLTTASLISARPLQLLTGFACTEPEFPRTRSHWTLLIIAKWMVSLQANFVLFPCSAWPLQPRTAANSHNAHHSSHKASILRQVWVPGGELERLDGSQSKAARGRHGTLCWCTKCNRIRGFTYFLCLKNCGKEWMLFWHNSSVFIDDSNHPHR